MANGLISVLVPERGRPEELDRLISSLLYQSGGDDHIEILVQIDNEDPAWANRQPFEHSRTRYIRKPQPPTLGEKLNQLALEARGDYLWFIANDMVVATADWPKKLRQAAGKLPNDMGIVFPRDPTHPDHASFYMMTRKMFEVGGIFAPPWFPYWFVDTWWDEISLLTGLRVEADIDLEAPDGRGATVGGRYDLKFWVDFFVRTRPLRLRDAMQLLAVAFGRELPEQAIGELRNRERVCVTRTEHLQSDAFLRRWGTGEAPQTETYREVRAIADDLLKQIEAHTPRRVKVLVCVPSGRSWEAPTANCVAALTAYSAMAGIEVGMLNVQTSMITHARNQTVKGALEQGHDYLLWIDSDMQFPPDALVRLLRHGRDIVGATYRRRTPPYNWLGKIAEGEGLQEAALLPAGMMLVRSAVYRSLAFPYYAEGYQWPGDDGLDRFKAMMRSYYASVPSDEVLASLDATPFGAWMRENCALGEDGEDVAIWSEDLYFCRQARRAGYQIWCDMDLTADMGHIGVVCVTSTWPPVENPAAALAPMSEAAD